MSPSKLKFGVPGLYFGVLYSNVVFGGIQTSVVEFGKIAVEHKS